MARGALSRIPSTGPAMHVVVWEFHVRPDAEEAFVRLYGPDGAWVALFRGSPGYLGTELLRATDGASRWLTIDRWRSGDAYAAFRHGATGARYAELDQLGQSLTEAERRIGEFELPGADDAPAGRAPVRPPDGLRVRAYEARDAAEWRRMRMELWPAEDVGSEAEMSAWLERPDAAVLVADRGDGRLAGFAEVATRPYADGCDTSPVGYLEGWYVDDDVRRRGVGAALVAAAERWARDRGLSELASDALLDNETSHRAHEAAGFTEVERAVRYRKAL